MLVGEGRSPGSLSEEPSTVKITVRITATNAPAIAIGTQVVRPPSSSSLTPGAYRSRRYLSGMNEHEDRREIHETVLRYCRAVDRLDLPGVRAVYAADGVDHHTGFSGTADEFVAWLGRGLPFLDGTMHLLGNHLVELAGDQALAETYGTATHWAAPYDDPRRNFTSGFRYVDHFVRTDEGWRIRERFAVREWARSDAGRILEPDPSGPRAHRGEDDPVAVLRRRLAIAPEGT